MGRGLLLPLLAASCLLAHAHPWEPCGYDQDYDDLTRGLFPSVFNLASNAGITVNATCGETGPETYCKLVEHIYNREPQCGECDASSRHADKRHPIEYAIDGSNRWWQSPTLQNGRKYQWVTITLDLKQVFQVAYIILKTANSPRPGNWILERSIDGVFYRPWQFYAITDAECWEAYGIAPTPGKPVYKTDDEVICTSYYSSLTPFEDGEVHTSLVNGRPGAEEFSEKLMDFTKARYVRLRLQRIRTLNADLMSFQVGEADKVDKSVTRRYYYSIKDISIGGQCVCSGHAQECPPKANGELHCKCEHNTCGASCERCCPMFNQQPWRMGTHGDAAECQECQCFGHATSCIYDSNVAKSGTSLNIHGEFHGGGVCQNCSHNTAGINCQQCQEGYFRPRGVPRDHRNPCRKCSCSGPGATGNCVSDDSHIHEGLFPGDCLCREGFTGPKCDRCQRGYRNYPRCDRCPCHYAGTIDADQCEGPCKCKKHVEGEQCDQCAHGYYDLSETNPEGCSSCYCFGVTSVCRPSDWGVETVKEPQGWIVTDLEGRREFRPTQEPGKLTIADDDVVLNMYYWQAPEKYLGNRLYSYGGDLKFMLSFVVARGDTSGTYVEGSDVIIEGDGKKLGYNWGVRPSADNVSIALPLREHGWHVLDRDGRPLRPATRSEFTLVLNDVERLLLRAKYHSDQVEGAMHHVELPSASKDSGSLRKMTSVEMCQCPTGYAGLSCELCAPGYRRVNDTLVGGRCEKCDCNNHADSCDAYTGQCHECLHNTTGSNCGECLPGFYGNAALGFPDDCRPCACPLSSEPNQFSSECRTVITPTGESDYVCTECPPNHAGNKCERCADGFYGNPSVPGEQCRPCRCGPNADTSVPGFCDHRTGRCLRCRGNTGGWNCLECLDGFFGNPATGDCRPCDCSVAGSLGPQCNKTTGQCNCRPSFAGRTCDRCQDGFGGAAGGCVPCRCNPRGSLSEICDPITGSCPCRPGVFGTLCDSCLEGHYGFTVDGCKWCGCDPHGSLDTHCDERTGQCPCKPNVVGRACDRCKPGFWNLASPKGCEPCACNVTGSRNVQCDDRTGQCPCKPGVGGLACDVCLPGHYRFSHQGCKECEPCEAPGHVCDEETGRCVCPKNTGGRRCDRCNTGAWGYDPIDGCKLCGCNKLGSLSPNCEELTGQCQCLEGFEGQRCDRCRAGYYNFPNCKRCDCHPAGTDPKACVGGVCQCDERGQCPCKVNVVGRQCDRCREGAFSLVESNPRGCTECFMFGRSERCSQANMVWGQVSTPRRDVTMTVGEAELDRVHHYRVIPGTRPGSTLLPVPYVLDQPLYWSLPDQFLGDKVLSYNGKLRFRVESRSRDVFPEAQLRQFPLVFLQGNHRILLAHRPKEPSETGFYSVPLHEDEWYQVDNPHIPVTRAILMVALQNLQKILIRATDGPDVKFASLEDVSLETAEPLSPHELSPYLAYGIEQGRCPFQYTASSCQDPAEGYYRKFKPNYLDSRDILDLVGFAEPCNCNNRTRECHRETGVCINCGGNTVGDHCERCEEGFFGTPSRGPCLPCACPLPTNSFSSTCQTHGPDYICTDCQEGYTGRRCERCADGFFGNPLVEGGRCRRCECNPYGAQGRRCDPITGECHCQPGIQGRDCSICSARHILTEYGCKSCDDDCTGRLLDDVEEMLALLDRLNATDIVSAPWIHLLAIQETTRLMRTDLDRYLNLVESGNQVLSNFSFHFNLETQADILLERARDTRRNMPDVVDGAYQVLLRANELLELINKYWKEIIDAVNHLKSHGIGHGGAAISIGHIVEEAKRILRELQKTKMEKPLDEAQRENRKAHQLLERVRNLVLNLQEVGDLSERLDRVERLLSEMIRRIENEVQKPTARALSLLEGQLRSLNAIQNLIDGSMGQAEKANASLVEAREWLRKAKDAIIDASFKFDELPRLLAELQNDTNALEERRGLLDRINPEYREKYVKTCQRHAAEMMAEVGRLADQFKKTQEVSEYPLRAAKVYQNIEDALKDAEEAARKASEAADRAFDEAYPRNGESLRHKAAAARERSEDLLQQAKQLRDDDIPELQYSMRAKKNMLKALENDIGDGVRAVAAINRELDKLPHDLSGPLEEALQQARGAYGKQETANVRIDGVLGLLAGMHAQIGTLQTGSAEGLDNLTRLIDDAQRGIKRADQLATRSEQSAARARKTHNQLQLNLEELRDKVLLARQRASSIRVSLSADQEGECSRSFRPEIESTTTNSIVLNYAIKEEDQNSLLFFIANSKGKDDFMAIEMVNRKIKFSWNAGGGTHSITHNMVIETNERQLERDSRWYKVEVFRVGNVATLSVKRKPDGARDDPEEITGAAPAGFGKMDLDASSHLYVGRIPDDIPAARELTATTFVGCLHEVILDGKQVGLWNFLTNEGCDGCKSGPTEDVDPSSYNFKGEGYSILPQIRRYDKHNYDVSMLIKTFDEDALLFLCPNHVTGDFMSLGLRGGYVVFQFKLGSNAPMELRSKRKYNTGNWTRLSAHRNKLEGVLYVEDEQVQGELPRRTVGELQLKDSKLYFGAVPPDFDGSRFSTVGFQSFIGCMKDLQVETTPLDLLKYEAYGVDPGCSDRKVKLVSFKGTGYLELKGKTLAAEGNYGFTFQSTQTEGLLMISTFSSVQGADAKRDHYYSVALKDGHLELRLNGGPGEVALRSEQRYNDNKFHTLTVLKRHRKVQVNVDDTEIGTLRLPKGTLEVEGPPQGGLFFGGIRSGIAIGAQAATRESFVGTIKDAVFNDVLLGFNSPVSHEGAGIGRPLRRPRPAPVEHDRMEVLTEQEQDQCADAPSHDVQEGAVKFGDSVHSYVRLHDVVHFKADFNLSLDIRTYYPNGILVLAQNPGHNRHLALLLSGGRVKLEVAERSPKKLVSHGNLNNGQWHHVHLSKEGSRLSLEVDDKPALKLQVHKRLPFRGPLHVGGIAKGVSVPEELKRESFKGCIRNFNLNGQMVDLAKGESRGIGVCFATIEPGALFEGDAYAVYGERFNVNDKLDMRLEFRTWRLNGVLLSLSKQPHGTPALAVELHEGEVIVSVDLGHNGTGPFRARKKFSSKQAMCDGQWHTLVVHVSRSEVSLRVDRHQAAYGLAPATPPEPHMESPLYIGGLPEGSTNGALFGRDNFVGCLRNVAVNDKRVEWIDMASLHNVLPNSCPAA
ncbi:laminin subunit alpha-1 [Ixodes scapularis]|uniref:laminin subunit alpha-1 n=1 Tax=Ixodes scapularis TaxID=6945 RepID=UPI001A9F7C9D|nr:laminin subunit alpha-1 [Ixodes scapularis]